MNKSDIKISAVGLDQIFADYSKNLSTQLSRESYLKRNWQKLMAIMNMTRITYIYILAELECYMQIIYCMFWG